DIVSDVHNEGYIDNTLVDFLGEIEEKTGSAFEHVKPADFGGKGFHFIFIKSGGTEGVFREMYPKLKPPFVLLTSGMHNSLAASMEIASFLRDNDQSVEIIHGDASYISKRMGNMMKIMSAVEKLGKMRLGVIGKPSDWLIASDVDYGEMKDALGITLIDIGIDELLESIENAERLPEEAYGEIRKKSFDKNVTDGALAIYSGLKSIVEKYDLDGFTLRCFDLLDPLGNTGCLALSLFNDDGVPAGCEGDIPALVSMAILKCLVDQPSFVANPSRIDAGKNEMVLAHCTVPMSITEGFELETHFESGIGIGIRGRIPEKDVTVFKLSRKADRYFVSKGEVLKNLRDPNLCRTQIHVKLEEDVNYFLTDPLGNHHLVCMGDHVDLINDFFQWL
ncbi:MAG TPA: hypothetical protein VJ990_10090, partial [Clostridia bacterium]|nr:hypothetical protein [Clostridia bacterium]